MYESKDSPPVSMSLIPKGSPCAVSRVLNMMATSLPKKLVDA